MLNISAEKFGIKTTKHAFIIIHSNEQCLTLDIFKKLCKLILYYICLFYRRPFKSYCWRGQRLLLKRLFYRRKKKVRLKQLPNEFISRTPQTQKFLELFQDLLKQLIFLIVHIGTQLCNVVVTKQQRKQINRHNHSLHIWLKLWAYFTAQSNIVVKKAPFLNCHALTKLAEKKK